MKTKKTRSRLFAVLATVCAAVAMLVCALGLTACNTSVVGTYTYTETGTSLKTYIHGGGFVDAVMNDNSKLTVTLELKEDETYVLTKHFEVDKDGALANMADKIPAGTPAEMVDVKLNFVYTGSYVVENGNVTLKACDKLSYKEDWGALFASMGGVNSGEGEVTATSADKGTNVGVLTGDYMSTFATMYFISADGNEDQTIILKGKSFEYVVENLDD